MSNLLYKYLDINGAIMMLYYSDLMYTNATMFNDPFDCHPSLIDCSNVPAENVRVGLQMLSKSYTQIDS